MLLINEQNGNKILVHKKYIYHYRSTDGRGDKIYWRCSNTSYVRLDVRRIVV